MVNGSLNNGFNDNHGERMRYRIKYYLKHAFHEHITNFMKIVINLNRRRIQDIILYSRVYISKSLLQHVYMLKC